jgi:ADP-heptose:LPS heptosyltransferase
MPESCVKLLFVTNSRLGDAVLSTALLGHLLEHHPEARVTIAGGPVALPLFAAVPGLERLIPLVKGRWHAHWRRLWLETVATRWDLVADLRSSAIPWLIAARRRLVFRGDPALGHKVRQLGALIGRPDDPPAPRLWVSAADLAEAERLVPRAGPPVLAVGPTANWGPKQWIADRFVAVVRHLTGPGGRLAGARLVVVAAAAEREAASPLLAAVPAERCIDLIGQASLPVLGACLGRAALYLGNDSGLMHLAAAAGAPTLGLFGPSREAVYGPWGPACASIRGPRSYDQIVATPGFDFRGRDCLMADLTVDAVTAAAEALLDRVGAVAARRT